MIYFDHTYTGDSGHRFLKHLQRLGFGLDPSKVEHPGKQFCRFIKFKSAVPGRKYDYLEFVWGKAKSAGRPGFCFGYSGGLEGFHEKILREKKFRSEFMHKNYDWKRDSKSRLPGWNFVSFKGLKMPGLFPWFTEYEPLPGKKRSAAPKHPNGARRVHGFVFELDATGEKLFSYVLRKKLSEKTRIAGGVTLYLSLGARRTRLRAVIIEMKSLKSFLRRYKPDSQGVFFGRDAARIENPDRRMWDLILV